MKKLLIIVTILLITGCSCEKKEEKIKKDYFSIRFGIEEPLDLVFKDGSKEKTDIHGICMVNDTLTEERKKELNDIISKEMKKQVNEKLDDVNNLEDLKNRTSNISEKAVENLNKQNLDIDYCAITIDKSNNES